MKVAYLAVLALLVNTSQAIQLGSEQRSHKRSSMGSRDIDSSLTMLSSGVSTGELFPED